MSIWIALFCFWVGEVAEFAATAQRGEGDGGCVFSGWHGFCSLASSQPLFPDFPEADQPLNQPSSPVCSACWHSQSGWHHSSTLLQKRGRWPPQTGFQFGAHTEGSEPYQKEQSTSVLLNHSDCSLLREAERNIWDTEGPRRPQKLCLFTAVCHGWCRLLLTSAAILLAFFAPLQISVSSYRQKARKIDVGVRDMHLQLKFQWNTWIAETARSVLIST